MRKVGKTDSSLRHGGYVIYWDGTEYVAEPFIPEDPIFEMGSQSVDRLIAMIDELWAAINSVTSFNSVIKAPPPWFETFLLGEVTGRVNVDVAPWVYDQEKVSHLADTVEITMEVSERLYTAVDFGKFRKINIKNALYREFLLSKYQNAGRARRANRLPPTSSDKSEPS